MNTGFKKLLYNNVFLLLHLFLTFNFSGMSVVLLFINCCGCLGDYYPVTEKGVWPGTRFSLHRISVASPNIHNYYLYTTRK